jgi:hypothetical protein
LGKSADTEMQIANKQMKRSSSSQAGMEMQITRTMKRHFSPIRLENILNIDGIQRQPGGAAKQLGHRC